MKACTSFVVERNDDVDYVKACTSLVEFGGGEKGRRRLCEGMH